MARTNALLLPHAAQALPPSCAGAKKTPLILCKISGVLTFCPQVLRESGRCAKHTPPAGGGSAKHRVERGIATHERRRKHGSFFCVLPAFSSRAICLFATFRCHLPTVLRQPTFSGAQADGSVPLEVLCLVVHGATRSALLPVLLSMEYSPRRRVLFLILRSASHGSLKTVDRFLQDRSVGKTD